MWQDGDDRIMDILDIIELDNEQSVPVVCPICGKKEGHFYLSRYKEGEVYGGMWVWCSACHHSAHARYRLPEWWKNAKEICFEELTAHPYYLEENKNCIDEWVNRLLLNIKGNEKG